MIGEAERILDSYAEGRLSRREAAAWIVGLAAAPFAAAAAPPAASPAEPTFRATALNHLGLSVTDVARSRDFYREHLGFSVIRDNAPGNCFLRAGHNYVGLFRSSAAAMDHFCVTVEGYEADDAMAKAEGAGLAPRRQENRVYFDDPDGLELQVDSRFGSWPGPPPAD